jgi:predicted small lipoprotein YifL
MTRRLAVLAALAALGPAACGRYGPPQRPTPAPVPAHAESSTSQVDQQAARPDPDSSETDEGAACSVHSENVQDEGVQETWPRAESAEPGAEASSPASEAQQKETP